MQQPTRADADANRGRAEQHERQPGHDGAAEQQRRVAGALR
jgi:hypothetical protein